MQQLKLSATHTVTTTYCFNAGEILPVINGTKMTRDNGGFAGQGIQVRSAGAIAAINTFLASEAVHEEVRANLLKDAADYMDDATAAYCGAASRMTSGQALAAAEACRTAAAKI